MKRLTLTDEDFARVISAIDYAAEDYAERADYEWKTDGEEEADFRSTSDEYVELADRVKAAVEPPIYQETYDSLRAALDDESISYGEIALIESVFEGIPDSVLRDRRENATADDMLDEIAGYYGLDA